MSSCQAEYTIQLKDICNVFNFDYDFYEEQYRCDFESKFIDHYYFNEIGSETVERFRHMLKAQLNLKMPYYTQLYETELRSEGIDFLLNKDLKETFIRTLDTVDDSNGTNVSNNVNSSRGTNNSSSSANSTDDFKESRIADGVASSSLKIENLTDVSQSNQRGSTSMNGNDSREGTSNTSGTSTEHKTGKEVEKTELLSQGNIGVVSPAELLEKWRRVIINLDERIIRECQDLFMGVY